MNEPNEPLPFYNTALNILTWLAVLAFIWYCHTHPHSPNEQMPDPSPNWFTD
jgi:hypothetical protein